VKRYTFVVQVHPDGPSTLENLNTHERVRVSDLDAVGPQLERWLDVLTEGRGWVPGEKGRTPEEGPRP
jgi:hypothetical protein